MTDPAAARLAILGGGVMGETVLGGLLANGWSATDIVVAEKRPQRRAELAERHGVRVLDNAEAAALAPTVLVVVKPQDVATVLDEVADALQAGVLVASLAAGVATSTLEEHLPAGTPVVRVMPNTPAQVLEGMAAVSGGAAATDAHLATVTEVMSAVGRAVSVPETYQDAVTAVSGSGPAYVFLVAEALIEGGVQAGLPRDVATELAVQTLYGSAKLLRETGERPGTLRERVTSPGGTTAAGLRALEDRSVRAAFMAAVEAASLRSAELGAKQHHGA